MPSARALVAFLAILTAQPALAECGYCPKSLTLSDELAQCYLDTVDQEIALAESTGIVVHVVNLGGCPGIDGKDRAPNPMPEPQTGDAPAQTIALDVTFLIEPRAMVCLKQELSAKDLTTTQILTLEVANDC